MSEVKLRNLFTDAFYHSKYVVFLRSQICSFVAEEFTNVSTWGKNSNNQRELTVSAIRFIIVCQYIVLWQYKLGKKNKLFVCKINFQGKWKQKYRIREISEKGDNIYQKMQNEILLQETYGKSEETSLCLIFSALHFQVWYFKVHKFVNKSVNCAKVYQLSLMSTFFDVQRYLVMTVKISASAIVLFTGKLLSSVFQNTASLKQLLKLWT